MTADRSAIPAIRVARAAALAAALVLSAGPAAAQTAPPDRQEAAAPGTGRVVYVPPTRGAPAGRIGGSTRGPAPGLPRVEVLAPDHVGFSASAQPTLYWFLGAPAPGPVQVTLDTAELTGRPPLLELELRRPAPGINALDLAARRVRLEPGRLYRWSVAVVVDGDQRSGDLLASGLVVHQPLAAPIDRGNPAAAAADFAARGYWYDAIATLSQAIAKPGDGQRLRRLRADLLEQVGLTAPAAHDGDRPAAR